MFIIAVIIVIFIIGLGKINDSGSIKKYTKREYRYTKKSCVITENELSFYKTLQEAVSGCVIIPQAHLSMFLEHRIKGQSWNGALNKIDRKSKILENHSSVFFSYEIIIYGNYHI